MKKLNILVCSVASVGHVNSCIGATKTLLNRAKNAGEDLALALHNSGLIDPGTPAEKMTRLQRLTDLVREQFYGDLDRAVKEAIDRLNPDLIWYDCSLLVPAVYFSGIPWVINCSMTPIFYEFDPELPPGGSGLPFNDRSGWEEFHNLRRKIFQSAEISQYFEEY
ncbi:hypothetical protein TYRP_023371 [Tyrophagus putrescentiae]|nr:hypothetical protein TYRP_023371 [Tyrophagus putrescentiae]